MIGLCRSRLFGSLGRRIGVRSIGLSIRNILGFVLNRRRDSSESRGLSRSRNRSRNRGCRRRRGRVKITRRRARARGNSSRVETERGSRSRRSTRGRGRCFIPSSRRVVLWEQESKKVNRRPYGHVPELQGLPGHAYFHVSWNKGVSTRDLIRV